ncbi:MAG: RAMP superfamily CRISPR-associated protein [Chloroflexales bacterium]
MSELRIALTITTLTPLSVGAGSSSGSRADKSVIRDGYGRPIIPGSQLKGKVRHAAEALVQGLGMPSQSHFDDDASPTNCIRQLFGSPQVRSPLRFADLTARLGDLFTPVQNRQMLSQLRPSVAISRRRGTAEDERLLLQETVPQGLVFSADDAISGHLGADELPAVALLWAALKFSPRWGGAKSRGLGWASIAPQIFWNGQSQPLRDGVLAEALRQLPKQKGAQ